MNILCIILLAIVFILAVADALFTIALWVIHKIDKEEIEEYEICQQPKGCPFDHRMENSNK